MLLLVVVLNDCFQAPFKLQILVTLALHHLHVVASLVVYNCYFEQPLKLQNPVIYLYNDTLRQS